MEREEIFGRLIGIKQKFLFEIIRNGENLENGIKGIGLLVNIIISGTKNSVNHC